MNNARRTRVRVIAEKLQVCQIVLDGLKTEEESCRDNMPESLQESERYEQSDNAVDTLEETIDLLKQAIDELSMIYTP